mmetsp:Transcript_8250/g.28944  ORF Transcript_8250/g.28944 Transcript_8250/m.28944 type:complete len:235 (-) Transcript_8250:377-1081(-)
MQPSMRVSFTSTTRESAPRGHCTFALSGAAAASTGSSPAAPGNSALIAFTQGTAHLGPCALPTCTVTSVPPLPVLPVLCDTTRRSVRTYGGTSTPSSRITTRITSSTLARTTTEALLSLGVFCRLTIASLPPVRRVLSGRSHAGVMSREVPSVSASFARFERSCASLCSATGRALSQSSTWSRSWPLHPPTVHTRFVRLKPTDGISKSRTYSAPHFSQRSAKQLPWSSAISPRG